MDEMEGKTKAAERDSIGLHHSPANDRPGISAVSGLDWHSGWCYAHLRIMATAASIPIEQYLKTIYEPDAELVGGEIEERNMGEYLHNLAQMAVLIWFFLHEKEWQIRSIQEQKTQLPWGDVRIPDVSVWPKTVTPEPVFTVPQLIAVEILSPEDRQSRMQDRIEDYRRFAIPHIWIIDPVRRVGWDCSSGNWIQTESFEVPGSPIHLAMSVVLAEMDAAGS